MSSGEMNSGPLLYLHFILLVFDFSCGESINSQGAVMISEHFRQLARLAYSRDHAQINESHPFILSQTLLLEVQAYLAGEEGSGSFVRAYLSYGSKMAIPHTETSVKEWSNFPITRLPTVYSICRSIHTRLAELSQLASRLRENHATGSATIAENSAWVTKFNNKLFHSWDKIYEDPSPIYDAESSSLAKTALDLVSTLLDDQIGFPLM